LGNWWRPAERAISSRDSQLVLRCGKKHRSASELQKREEVYNPLNIHVVLSPLKKGGKDIYPQQGEVKNGL